MHCEACGLRFYNRFQLGPHRRVCEGSHNSAANTVDVENVNVDVDVESTDVTVDVENTNADVDVENAHVTVPVENADATVPVENADPQPLYVLSQRPSNKYEEWGRAVPYARRRRVVRRPHFIRDYTRVSVLLIFIRDYTRVSVLLIFT